MEPGLFTMGSPESEFDRIDDENQTQVTLTQGFYLGKYEVTQSEYESVMEGASDDLSATPSNWPGNPNRPVDRVSWNDIQVFLTRLNELEADNIENGWSFVLPTEAEWEYACRAGNNTAYNWGDLIQPSNANFSDSGNFQTQDVGQYLPNAWGFYDMHGNVWEWTADWYQSYSNGPLVDPEGPENGSHKSLRGGAWSNGGANLRSARRGYDLPDGRHNSLGFRIVYQLQPDILAPTINLVGGTNVLHKRDELWQDPGFDVSDERDGNLTNSVTISGSVDVSITGSTP